MNVTSLSLYQDGLDSPPDLYGNFLQVIVVLAVIIGLIVVVIRFLAMKNKQWTGNRALHIHAGVTLGQHKSLQIVEIGGTLYIVGVGDSITLIDKIDDEARAAELLSTLTARQTAGFETAAGSLTQWLKRKNKQSSANSSEPTDVNDAFQALLQQKLKSMGNRKETLKAWMEEEPKRESSDDR